MIKASKLHFATDIWIELPSFTAVLVTGFMMLTEDHLEGLFLVKVVFGVLAIVFNLICVYAVYVRNRYAKFEDFKGMASTDRAMKIGGAGFIPSFLVAFSLGCYFMVQ